MQRSYILSAAFLGLVFFPSVAAAQKQKETQVVKNGSIVSVEYTLSDEKGKVIESNKGKKPLTYTQGSGQILPGLEKGLAGLKRNDQKNLKLKPEEAYGTVDPTVIHEVPREKIPPEAQKAGTTVIVKNAQGSFPVRVVEVKEKTVVVDFNHPLAGKTLSYDVRILDIKQTSAPQSRAR